jgi:murein DD-endopeptidase MepM/ murein hydrolase activator NlpD
MGKLLITRPIRSSRITQHFGENKACVDSRGRVTGTNGKCPVNTIPFYKSVGLNGHNGIDIAAIHGEMVYHSANFEGWMKIEKDEQGGIGVDVVSHKPVMLPDGTTRHVKMRYWHLKTAIGFDGKDVVYGQAIGLADNTGASSGDHLHFAPKYCDKDGNGLESSNGFAGAFDFSAVYTHSIFAGDSAKYMNMPAPNMTPQERKEVYSQLTVLRRTLLGMREIMHKL